MNSSVHFEVTLDGATDDGTGDRVFGLVASGSGRLVLSIRESDDAILETCEVKPGQLHDLRDFISFLLEVEPWEVPGDE